MPLPGGATDKIGNRYELRWTVQCLIDILDERLDRITIEQPGEEGKGAEFWVEVNGVREHWQIKRHQGRSGAWTLANLQEAGILHWMQSKLVDPEAKCCFASTSDAVQLRELAENAKQAASWEDFDKCFLSSGDRRKYFECLLALWPECSQEQVFDYLNRITVRTKDEVSLREDLHRHLVYLVEQDSTTTADVLLGLALDSIHLPLTNSQIWAHLQEKSIKRRQWDKDPHLRAAVDRTTSHYVEPAKAAYIAGNVIPRDELETAISALRKNRIVLIEAQAGGGKTAITAQITEQLQRAGTPVLAFRLDRLEPCTFPEDVGRQLNLPGSPANVLAAVANGQPSLLVIDQLDTVSSVSGQYPGFYDCIDEILRQALLHPKVTLLLSCRKFDMENDSRLRQLKTRDDCVVIQVGLLSEDLIRRSVSDMGSDPSRLTHKQLDLLRIPLHLKLLTPDCLEFENSQDLFDQYWYAKRRAVAEKRSGIDNWTRVIDCICDYMSKEQVLFAPDVVVDDYLIDAETMASQGILVCENRVYAFFHAAFFDYAFARRFVAHGSDILDLLRQGEQHLFRRAQVRQTLLYERRASLKCYPYHVASLLESPEIREHIREVTLDFLAALDDPSEDEWSILNTVAAETNIGKLNRVWKTIRRSQGWFQLLASTGVIQNWLAGNDETHQDMALRLLIGVEHTCADKVAELLEPYVSASSEWLDRVTNVMRLGDPSKGRRFFELFLKLIDAGALDDRSDVDFWFKIEPLSESHADWACEAILKYFHRGYALSNIGDISDPFNDDNGTIRDGHDAEAILDTVATKEPVKFLEEILPLILSTMERTAVTEDGPPWQDSVWRFRHRGRRYRLSEQVLHAVEIALSVLADERPLDFARLTEQLHGYEYETAQFLLMRAYTVSGHRYADQAIQFLLDDPNRLQIGYIMDYPSGAAIELIKAVSHHSSPEKRERLEELLLSYYPDWELRRGNKTKYQGLSQFDLLRAIDPSIRSPRVVKRLSKWSKKFRDESVQPRPPIPPSIGGPVQSPVPNVDELTDEEWLVEIQRHSNENEIEITERGIIGGVRQLAPEFERVAQRQPERFAELALRLPDDTHPYYFESILRAISGVAIDLDKLVAVCCRCHQLPGRPCGRWIHRPIASAADKHLPDAVLDIVAWYATESPDPEPIVLQGDDSNDSLSPDDIHTYGVNTVRGSAAESVGRLIYAKPERLGYFLPTLKMMVADPSIAVRSCVAQTLISVFRHDHQTATELFRELCDTKDELLSTYFVERFISYAVRDEITLLEPILRRMMGSTLEPVGIAGARQACIAALVHEECRHLAEACLSGSEAHRLGAAEVFSANLGIVDYRSYSEECLIRLFDDESDRVRAEASSCFGELSDCNLSGYGTLIERFAVSKSVPSQVWSPLYALKNSCTKIPESACLIVEAFLNRVGKDANDIQTAAAHNTEMAVELLGRIYNQSSNESTRSLCLDLIDKAIVLGFDRAGKLLTEYDR